MGAVGSAESWHGDAVDAAAVERQIVEGAHAYKKGKGRVESTTDTHYHMLTTSVMKTLGKSGHLDIEDFLARCRHIAGFGNEWQCFYGMQQSEISTGDNRLCSNKVGHSMTLCIDEGRVGASLCPYALNVNLLDFHLRLKGESLCLGNYPSVLDDDGIAAIYYILGALAESARRIHITTDGACALLCEQRAQIGMLADEFIACREIEDDVGSCKGEIVARRDRCPYILAYLDAEFHTVASGEHLGA